MNTMENDADLPTLMARQDHLNVLRYIRVHELREPELVVHHGLLLLTGTNNNDKDKKLLNNIKLNSNSSINNLARLAALEQVCLAALDLQRLDLAQMCLERLRRDAGGVVVDEKESSSVRLRHLTARCLEATQDYSGAQLIYQELIQENPSNLVALKRLYCIARAQVADTDGGSGSMEDACNALHHYLEFNYADTAAWSELARLRMEMGDFKSAAFSLEEVILAMPADSDMHVALAECYSTLAASSSSSTTTTTTSSSSLSDLEYCLLARKHMAQALELDITNRRALFGLIVTSNDYLVVASQASSKTKKQLAASVSASSATDDDDDGKNNNSSASHDHEQLVAKELIKFGAEHLLQSYKGTTSKMFAAVQSLLSEYTKGL